MAGFLKQPGASGTCTEPGYTYLGPEPGCKHLNSKSSKDRLAPTATRLKTPRRSTHTAQVSVAIPQITKPRPSWTTSLSGRPLPGAGSTTTSSGSPKPQDPTPQRYRRKHPGPAAHGSRPRVPNSDVIELEVYSAHPSPERPMRLRRKIDRRLASASYSGLWIPLQH